MVPLHPLRNSRPVEEMNWLHTIFPIPFALVVSCGIGRGPGEIVSEPSIPPNIPGGVPPTMRGSRSPGAATPSFSGPVQLTPEEDIIFTDPDNPDADIPELAALLDAKPKRRKGPWEQSETMARKRSVREAKPLLIWFTDSRRSPMCKALSQELFNNPDFHDWAEENMVRLKVDSNIQANDPDLSLDEKETRLADLRSYTKRLRKQYKVLGNPNLVLVHPNGNVINRFRGYNRGEAEFRWGQLKQGVASFQHEYEQWRRKMEKKGYRLWTDRKGRTVFAKWRYHDGTLHFVESDGTRSKTDEKKLSQKDRDWIDEQKKLRGL